jgi:hypothetical protein
MDEATVTLRGIERWKDRSCPQSCPYVGIGTGLKLEPRDHLWSPPARAIREQINLTTEANYVALSATLDY